MEKSIKSLHAPHNEQWAFIQSLMNMIEKRDDDILTLRGKCERSKAIMVSHGIRSSEISSGVLFLG